jgi:RNA-directed DNA polymerase
MSVRLFDTPEQLRAKLEAAATPRAVAALLDVTYAQLTWHIYRSPPTRRYRSFTIPKSNGGTRLISAPDTSLRMIQSKLDQVLRAVYQPNPSAHGFIETRNIVSNARPHRGQRWVLNLDLANFFPSINFGRVRGAFMAYPFHCPPAVATVMAQICCHDNVLPQGAPTSPVVSNIICSALDSDLRFLAHRERCRYTRYCDDLTFSTSEHDFPREITVRKGLYEAHIGPALRDCITGHGFEINPRKTRLLGRAQRQEVTGLTVNQKVNVSRRFVRNVRAMLHAWERYGEAAAESRFHKVYMNGGTGVSFRQVLAGRISFIGLVRGRTDPVYRKLRSKFALLDTQL